MVKVKVYSLTSSAKCHSPDFTQLPPGHRTCSFISHLNSLGSLQPGYHLWRTELFKHTSLHCPTRCPLTLGWRECTCEQSTLPRSTTSEHIQCSWGLNPWSCSLVCRTSYHWATMPRHHMWMKCTLKDEMTELMTIYALLYRVYISPDPVRVGATKFQEQGIWVLSQTKHSAWTITFKGFVDHAALAQLRNVADMRHYLTREATETLMHGFITTWLDYCKAHFFGISTT